MTARRSYRRKQYHVGKPLRQGLVIHHALFERSYQWRFVTRLCLVIFSVALSSSLLAIAILWKFMYRAELERQTSLVAALIGVAVATLTELIIAIPIVYRLGTRQSHDVVGPLRRINKALGAIGSGDFSQRLVLRQTDILDTLAKSINRMAESLQKRSPQRRESGE
jgi:nitrate/nitrite-specific signal transduction histidine kinase